MKAKLLGHISEVVLYSFLVSFKYPYDAGVRGGIP